ncbi:indoleacetamide hydrolase [Saccharothrix violaceirubra]|uniref:Mandelamide amidase n=1 Tax=Saccharothrix violaceirubra TaxID=413306 RepID=A0A7W7WWL4_9PSEU|nr:amidase family protein [Saccharothrix violaceirubra]MBB4966499.1 mandelamide amidase [Saccharothrix violaceirubra]
MAFTLSDWSDLDPVDRAHRRAEALDRARASTHGDWTALADGADTGAPDTGPLAGIPFSVKDNIDVEGFATTGGSALLDPAPAAVDATVVSLLRAAGAVVVGKANLHELAFGITSDNHHTGAVRNPVDPTRSAGGSSGGSAASVALGVVPFSLGTDTGGSVTIPSSFCGIAGFRPSTGRYPGDGVANLSTSRDTIGLHARTVADLRAIDRVITCDLPVRAGLAGLRVGLPTSRFVDLDPEVDRVVRAVLSALEGAGAVPVEVDLGDDLEIASGPGNDLVFHEAPRLLARRTDVPFEHWPEHIASPDVRTTFERLRDTPTTVSAYYEARAARQRLRRAYSDVFSRVDVVFGPTSPVPAPPLGQNSTITHNGHSVPAFGTVTRTIGPGTVAGLPMLTVPAGTTAAGLPVGVCLEAGAFHDPFLLAVGAALEDLLG